MQDEIRPLYLIPNENVEVKVDNKMEPVACVERDTSNRHTKYIIKLNKISAKAMFQESWVRVSPRSYLVTFDTFLSGLMLHEVSHIKYKSFDIKAPATDGTFHAIHNILLDSQCEYSLTMDHPSTSPYIRVCLSILKRDTDLHSDIAGAKQVEKMVSDLFYLTRFGVVRKGTDIEYVNFILPHVLAAIRQNNMSVMDATKLIYQYIYSKSDKKTRQLIKRSTSQDGSFTNDNIKEAEEGQKVASSSVLNSIKQIKSGKFIVAGKTDNKVELQEKDSGFYRKTVDKHYTFIQNLRHVFKMRLDKIKVVPAVEGDLNIRRQMQAYVSSYTQEPTKDYHVYKRILNSLDVVIIRDISGSTSGEKVEYAEMTVCLLAALQDFSGIRVAEIDFSDDSFVNLNFGEKVSQTRVNPRAEAGTVVSPAYRLALDMQYQGKKRIWIVITDGAFHDSTNARYWERIARESSIKIRKYHISQTKQEMIGDLHSSTFSTFAQDISEFLVNEL